MTANVESSKRIRHVSPQPGPRRRPPVRPVSSNYFRRHKLVTSMVFVIILITLFVLSGAHFGSTSSNVYQSRAAAPTIGQARPVVSRPAPSTLDDLLGFGVILVPSPSRPLFPITTTAP